MTHQLRALLRLTFAQPRAAAAETIALAPARPVLIEAAALVSILAVFVAWAAALAASLGGVPSPILHLAPLTLAIVQFMSLMLTALLVHAIGRAFGGRGSFEQALAVIVWLQAVMLVVELGIAAIALIAPGIVGGLTLGAYFWFFYLLAQFITVLHGFSSAWKVAGAMLMLALLLSSGVAVLLGMLGGLAG